MFIGAFVQEIQSLLINWKGCDLTTYGELVLEGTFHVLRAKNTRTLFLFEKMLLITKKRGENYVYKIHILVGFLTLFSVTSSFKTDALLWNHQTTLFITFLIAVLHLDAAWQCQGSSALQCYPFQTTQTAAYSAGNCRLAFMCCSTVQFEYI